MQKKIISFLLLTYMFVSIFTNICYAAVAVTQENLNETFQKFTESEINEENYNISISNNAINITVDNENYTLSYDLTDKPTFSFEVPIETGMSYDEFKKQTDNLVLPLLGYVAVANIQGVEFTDAYTYVLFSYLENALNGSVSIGQDSYIIIDDLDVTDGVTVETENPNAIYASEFGDRVIEYVNAVYSESQKISDEDDINSYELTIEKQEMTETSGKLVSTLSVNLDADFSKLNGFADQIEDSLINSGITKENADYVITLKVGQKCKIESNEDFQGYELYGGCVEFDRENAEITATKTGEANGYFYIGENKKSYYIIVEENTNNENLETIILKLDTNKDNEDKINVETNTDNEDNTTVQEELPKTGVNNLIFIIGLLMILVITINGMKIKEYKDIK